MKKLHQFLAPRSPSGDRGVFLCKKQARAAARCPVQQPFSIMLKILWYNKKDLAGSPSQSMPVGLARFPLLSLTRHLPPAGGSLSSKGEPLAVPANVISLPRPLPLGEVDLRSKDGEGEDADNDQEAYHKIFQNFPLPFYSFFIAS